MMPQSSVYCVCSKMSSSRPSVGIFSEKLRFFSKVKIFKNNFNKKWWAYRVYISQKKLGWMSSFIISLWCLKAQYCVCSKMSSSRPSVGIFSEKLRFFSKVKIFKNNFNKKWWAYRVYISQKKLGWMSSFIISLWCLKAQYCVCSKMSSSRPSAGTWKFSFHSICLVLSGLANTVWW